MKSFIKPGVNISEEACERMAKGNKIMLRYVSERSYQSIKEMGDYFEEMVQGVPVLFDHSCEKLDRFVIIKSPRMKKAML